jgi:hypothetical protein
LKTGLKCLDNLVTMIIRSLGRRDEFSPGLEHYFQFEKRNSQRKCFLVRRSIATNQVLHALNSEQGADIEELNERIFGWMMTRNPGCAAD